MDSQVGTMTSTSTPVWHYRTPKQALLRWLGWFSLVALTVFSWQLMNENTIWAFVSDAPEQAADIGDRMFPPAWGYINNLWEPLWDTINIATLGTLLGILIAVPVAFLAAINIATLGTLLGILIAVPVAFLAATNTTPSTRFVRPLALLIIVASRSINSLIWALLLVAIIGPGLLAGIVAIGLRSIGFIAKLLYEAIEEIDDKQVEAVRATGASGAQVIDYAVVPQILPAFWGISVFRGDINIRESTILGLVGAGGLGIQLNASLSTLAWNQVAMIFIVILGTVVISEWVSAKVREAVL